MVARTEEEVLQEFFDISNEVGFLTGRFKESRIGLLFTVLSREIAKWESYQEDRLRQGSIMTATDEQIVENQSSLLTTRVYASQSNVYVRFYRNQITGDISIPINLVVETGGEYSVRYFVVEDEILYDGEEYVDVRCLSVETGASTMVGAGELCLMPIQLADLTIENIEPSYGGKDDQSIESMRDAALASRYELEHGTENSIKKSLRDYGLKEYEFSLVDIEFGSGSFGVYLNVSDEHIISDVESIIQREKAEGIYTVVEQVELIPCEFDFKIHMAQTQDMLQSEIEMLRLKLEDLFRIYIEQHPIGADLILSQVVYSLFQGLYGFREDKVADLHITTDSWLTKQDEHGNILLDNNEVIQLSSLNITIEVG